MALIGSITLKNDFAGKQLNDCLDQLHFAGKQLWH